MGSEISRSSGFSSVFFWFMLDSLAWLPYKSSTAQAESPDRATKERQMPYAIPESEQCSCCRNDVGCGDHEVDCPNAPTELETIEALAALWWDGREDDTADEAAHVSGVAERFAHEGGAM
jgi:hypothetical protein